MGPKQIRNIAYNETSHENEPGEEFPRQLGEIYHAPANYSIIGQRFALLLRERDFKLPDFDQLYITFSSFLPAGKLSLSDRASEKGIRYVNYGVDPDAFNGLSDAQKRDVILEITGEILKGLFAQCHYEEDYVDEAIACIRLEGERLEVNYLSKADANIHVDVNFQLLDSGQCCIYANLFDVAGALVRRVELTIAHCFSQAEHIIGSILIRKNRIIIKPQHNIVSKVFQPFEIDF